MLRWLPALALSVALLAPAVAAFPSDGRPLVIAFDQARTPVVIATGELGLDGELRGGLLLAGAEGTRLGPVPRLTVTEPDRAEGARNTTHERATLVVSSGQLVWAFAPGGRLDVSMGAPYALGLAIPEAPVPTESGEPLGAGFLLVGGLAGSGRWSGAPADLLLVNATVTLLGASGRPLPGWDERRINEGSPDAASFDAVFRLEGDFDALLSASIVGGAAGEGGDVSLGVGRAEEDRFAETLDTLGREAGALFGGEEGDGAGPFAGGGPLEMLGTASGLLNGAVVVVNAPEGDERAATPVDSRVGNDAFDLGAFNLVRGDDMTLQWAEGEMRVQGTPSVALGRDGFAVEPPTTVLFLPILSLLLWAAALGALVLSFVRRPPEAATRWSWRLGSFALYLVALVVVFVLWDASFAQTFGTSALREARATGISGETLPAIGLLFAFEMVPWGIAALLFALPVRIAAGIGLRYLGHGKSLKGAASAAGVVALGVIGPFYAMWCFDLVMRRALAMAG